MLYRIVTERKNVEATETIIDKYFDCYTTIEAKGKWHGTSEPSIIFEIIAGIQHYPTMKQIAREIDEVNGQEAVLVQSLQCNSVLV
jgi:uncharacterized membrane-anchored protein YitT (DUF2179 family)